MGKNLLLDSLLHSLLNRLLLGSSRIDERAGTKQDTHGCGLVGFADEWMVVGGVFGWTGISNEMHTQSKWVNIIENGIDKESETTN